MDGPAHLLVATRVKERRKRVQRPNCSLAFCRTPMKRPRPLDRLADCCWLPRLALGFTLGIAPSIRADLWSSLFPHDVDVITVTDMTEIGRTYPHATPVRPVYYMIINLGEKYFGRSWAGEKVPKSREALKWMQEAMAKQGYLLANEQHPPTQLFVFAWGMLQGGPDRPALKFLGGDKADLMWEQEKYGGFVSPRVLLRGFQRTGVVGKVWDTAESDLFLGIVRSYTMDSLKDENKPVLLWETRFGCPAVGLWMTEALPQMIKAASLNLGRETKMPVNLNATEAFKGHVDYGELKVIGTVPTSGTEPPEKNPPSGKPGSP